jgi:membrane protein DedA with SNARE-associated domain
VTLNASADDVAFIAKRIPQDTRQESWTARMAIAANGYWIVAGIIAMESMGIPAPGETALVSAAIYAGTTHRLNIVLLIVAATIGAIVGDNLGYLIGRRFGYDLLLRHGARVGVDERRLKLGRYLFARHGGKVVFFGRFVAVLRALAAVLAGTTCLAWRRFLFFNAAGAIAWAGFYGTAAYVLGERIVRLQGPMAIAGIATAAVVTLFVMWWLRGHYAALQQEAERAMPGPLSQYPTSLSLGRSRPHR